MSNILGRYKVIDIPLASEVHNQEHTIIYADRITHSLSPHCNIFCLKLASKSLLKKLLTIIKPFEFYNLFIMGHSI